MRRREKLIGDTRAKTSLIFENLTLAQSRLLLHPILTVAMP